MTKRKCSLLFAKHLDRYKCSNSQGAAHCVASLFFLSCPQKDTETPFYRVSANVKLTQRETTAVKLKINDTYFCLPSSLRASSGAFTAATTSVGDSLSPSKFPPLIDVTCSISLFEFVHKCEPASSIILLRE